VRVGIRLSLAFFVLMVSACGNNSKEKSLTSLPSLSKATVQGAIRVLPTLYPTKTHEVPTVISLTPTPIIHSSTSFPESPKPMLKGQTLQPGVYPVYWKNGALIIVFPSGATKEILHLYYANEYESPSGGEIIGLMDSPGSSILPSPSGNSITFMYSLDGCLYNYNIFTNEFSRIPQPESCSSLGLYSWSGDWSPDGRYLLYSIDHGTPQEFPSLFISEPKKGSFYRLTYIDSVEVQPVWSPDYQWIAFASDRAKFEILYGEFNGATDIYIKSSNCLPTIESCKDSFTKQITNTGYTGDAYRPIWSPDGTNLAYMFIDGQTGATDIFLYDSNGKSKNITNTPNQREEAFRWSPDGKQLLFSRYSFDYGSTDLFILDLASGKVTNITNSPEIDEGIPFWSPDGKSIAYDTDTDHPETGISIYSVSEKNSKIIANSTNGKFLFWMPIFPEISNGAKLVVSPAGHDLNLRDAATRNGNVIGKLQSGESITILAQPISDGKNPWWRVRSGKGEGWVLGNYNWFLPDDSSN
jgi:Tol biopolymer transport system component